MMLIKVFGIWLIASNINHLVDIEDGINRCRVAFKNYPLSTVIIKPCKDVAEEINKQIKGQSQ